MNRELDLNEATPLDDYHKHEVVHTANMLATMFTQYVAEHRYTLSEPDLRETADRIAHLLRDFYQLVNTKLR